MQNITFKLFHQDEIRRVTVPRPSFPQFLEFVHELFPEIKPEVRVTYVDSDGDKVTVSSEVEWTCALDEQKKDKIARFTIESGVARKRPHVEPHQLVHVSYYTEDSKEDISKSRVNYLTGAIRPILEKYVEGPLCPKNLPVWLKPAVKFLPQTNEEFDLDVNVAELFNVLHHKAYTLLSENNPESILKAKFVLLDCLTLLPQNIFGLYNLACAEALLGETSSALVNLKKAVRAGYQNWKHMETDSDLKNLYGNSEFKELVDGLKAREQTATAKATEEAAAQAEKEKEKEKEKLDAETKAKEREEERKRRALEMIRFAEQRRLKLEEESRERAAQAVEQAMKEQEEALKKKSEAEQQAQEQKRKEEEAREATISQLRNKWATSVQNLTDMGFVMDFDNLQKLDRVQGSVEAFFADS